MRRHAPVYRDEANDVWGIALYDDVMAIEKDARTFSSKRAPRPHGDPLPMMISMDNPEHQQRRSLVYRGITPRRVQDHSARIQELCTQIIDKVCEQGECDFVWDIAAPLPLLLIADMLGFPEEAFDDLLRWSDDMMRGTTGYPDPENRITPEQIAAHEAGLAFREFQMGVIADRRSKPPQDDLVSLLCYAEIDGHKLDLRVVTLLEPFEGLGLHARCGPGDVGRRDLGVGGLHLGPALGQEAAECRAARCGRVEVQLVGVSRQARGAQHDLGVVASGVGRGPQARRRGELGGGAVLGHAAQVEQAREAERAAHRRSPIACTSMPRRVQESATGARSSICCCKNACC